MPVCASLSGYGDDNVVSDSDEIARESDAGLYSATLPLFIPLWNSGKTRNNLRVRKVSGIWVIINK